MMKTIFYIMVCAAFMITGCEKKKLPEYAEPAVTASEYKIDVVTTRTTTIEGSNLILPIGSRIQVAADEFSIKVTLPDDYGFLYNDTNSTKTALRTLPVTTFATYSCVCSGKGSSCQTFYQEQAGGFGCLHQSCSGSCTGQFVTIQFQQVVGVVKLTSTDITIPKNLPFTPASLEPTAKKLFFEIPEVQEKIREQYELMYRFVQKPDFRKLDPEHQSLHDYVYVRVQLYGVDFYMLGPAEFSQRTDQFEVLTTKATCKCGSSTGACSSGSGGFLGWKVYYCSGGCNGCQMTITKSVSPGISLPDNDLPLKPVPSTIPKSL